MKHLFPILCVAILAGFLGTNTSLRAASASWSATPADADWSNGLNWDGGVAPGATSGTSNTDTATFSTAGTTVNPDFGRNIQNLTFDAGAGNFTIGMSGGFTLLLTNGGIIRNTAGNTGNQTFAGNLELEGEAATYTFRNNSTGAAGLHFNGQINGVSASGTTILNLTGSHAGYNASTSSAASQILGVLTDGTNGGKLGVVKSGIGTWQLGGVNLYTGDTVVNAGTLALNYGASGSTVLSNIVNPSSRLVLGGGFVSLRDTGASSPTQTFNGLLIQNGASSMNASRISGGSMTVLLNAITRNTGATLDFSALPSGGTNPGITTTSTANNGTLGGFMTVIQGSWATATATNNAGGRNIVAYAHTATEQSATAFASGTSNVDLNGLNVGTVTSSGSANSLRFNTAGGTVLNLAGNTLTLLNGGILMTPTTGASGGSITNGILRSAPGQDLIVNQWNNAGLFTIGASIVDNGGATPLTLSGTGTLSLSGSNSFTGALYLNGGALRIGGSNALRTSTVAAPTNAVNFQNETIGHNGTTFVTPPVIAGTLATAGNNAAVASLSTANVFGGTAFLQNSVAGSTGNGSLTINGSNSTTFDGTIRDGNGGSGTFSLIKDGSGIQTIGGSLTYTGSTSITGGRLVALNSIASSSTIDVGVSGVLDVTNLAGGMTVTNALKGSGTVAGALTIAAGGHIAGGSSGVGTLTLNTLTLSGSSVLDFEFNGVTNDRINVLNLNGLTINGGGFNLFTEGGTSKFLLSGTYNLIGFSGTAGGLGVAAFTPGSVLNPQAGLSYSFAQSGTFVTLTIAGTPTGVGIWQALGGGSWNTPGNWQFSVPNGVGDIASFLTAITAPSVVNLDGSKTVGTLEFSNTNAYTIATGTGAGSLIINNGASPSSITDSNGSHTVSAAMVLVGSSNNVTVTKATDSLTLSGVVSGSTGAITKLGAGKLVLLGTNTYGGGVSIEAGVVNFGAGGLSSGQVAFKGGSLQYATGNTQDVSAQILNSTAAMSIDTNGNTVTFASPLAASNAAGLTKTGSGTLILTASNLYAGDTTVTSGTLRLGNGGGTGDLPAGSVLNVSNGATFFFNRGSAYTFTNTILSSGTVLKSGSSDLVLSGTFTNNGALVHNGSGVMSLNAAISGIGTLTQSGSGVTIASLANTFSGDTLLSSGTLQLLDANGLQNSTLNSAGGKLSFSSLVSAVLGGIKGFADVVLTNDSASAVALNVGGNGQTNSYSGALSGTGATLTKVGGGTQILSGSNSYTGSTTVSGGVLQLDPGGSINGAGITTAATSGVRFVVAGGSLTANATSTINQTGLGFLLSSGSAKFTTIQTSSANDGSLIRVDGGTFEANDVNLGRSSNSTSSASTTSGFYITGGTVNVGTARAGTSNSSASIRIDDGIVNATGAITVGNQVTAGRGGILQVNGGSLTVSDTTSGIILAKTNGANANNVATASFTGGLTTTEKFTLGFDNTVNAGSATISVTGTAALYIGSGGIVNNGTTGFTTNITLASGTTDGGGDPAAIVGAKESWSSSVPMSVSGSGITFKSANAANTAKDIVLTGGISGAGNVTKTGGGVLALLGPTALSGTVNALAGELRVSGTVGPLNVASGATFAPSTTGTGASPASVATVGDFNLLAGSRLALDLSGTSAGTLYDQVVTTGTVSLSGSATISLAGGYTPIVGDKLYLILNDGSDSIAGQFASINGQAATEGSLFNVGGYLFQLTYLANGEADSFTGGNDVAILAQVPEPGTWAMMVSGLGVLAGVQRMRRRRR